MLLLVTGTNYVGSMVFGQACLRDIPGLGGTGFSLARDPRRRGVGEKRGGREGDEPENLGVTFPGLTKLERMAEHSNQEASGVWDAALDREATCAKSRGKGKSEKHRKEKQYITMGRSSKQGIRQQALGRARMSV